MEISADKYPTSLVPIVLLYLLLSTLQETEFAFHRHTRHLDVVGKVTLRTVTWVSGFFHQYIHTLWKLTTAESDTSILNFFFTPASFAFLLTAVRIDSIKVKPCSLQGLLLEGSLQESPSVLTFYSLAVCLSTTRFNIQKFYMALASLWVFCTDIKTDSHFCFRQH